MKAKKPYAFERAHSRPDGSLNALNMQQTPADACPGILPPEYIVSYGAPLYVKQDVSGQLYSSVLPSEESEDVHADLPQVAALIRPWIKLNPILRCMELREILRRRSL
uniref:Uncharacterized protein n=1 Tax=Vespula pensylvanica TaxID=30213 RepID=A0A834P2N4_VESPE|nr:hypothetical protein H0235_008042 [Vespula pensylvanica]